MVKETWNWLLGCEMERMEKKERWGHGDGGVVNVDEKVGLGFGIRLILGLYRMDYWVWVTGFGLDPNG